MSNNLYEKIDFKIEFESKFNILNHFNFDRYLKFINSYQIGQGFGIKNARAYEIHHILPKSMFPEYIDTPSNLIKLPIRAHFIAHWLLARSIGREMWQAFFFMSNQYSKLKSYDYETARLYVCQATSKRNAIIFPGTVNVRCKNNPSEVFRVPVDDPRFVTGEIINARVGFEHSETTKYEIGKGIRDKLSYVNAQGEIRYFGDEDTIPKGFELGYKYSPPKNKIERIWVHDPITHKDTKWPKSEPIPEGWSLGRKNGPGFKHVNENSTRKVIDLITKCKLQEDTTLPLKPHTVMDLGRKLASITLVQHGEYIISTTETLNDYLHAHGMPLPKQVSISAFRSMVIKPSLGYKNALTKPFTIANQGKTATDLGFKFIEFNEFVWQNTMTVWRSIGSRPKRNSRKKNG